MFIVANMKKVEKEMNMSKGSEFDDYILSKHYDYNLDGVKIEKEYWVKRVKDADFRNIKWSFNKEDVLEYETAKLIIDTDKVMNNNENFLIFEEYIYNTKYDLYYIFNKNNKIKDVFMINENANIKSYIESMKYFNDLNGISYTLLSGLQNIGDMDYNYIENLINNLEDEEVTLEKLINDNKIAFYHKWNFVNSEIILSLKDNIIFIQYKNID